jgi:hypothetical protein
MAITPLNMGGTGADLSATGGANEFVKQTAAGANFSVATLATADVAGVGIVKNPSAAQSITGQSLSLTQSAPLYPTDLNNVLSVGDAFSTTWGSADIGAQINAAYAALPANGGTILIAPKANGAAYTYSTPIVCSSAAGKCVRIVGLGCSSQTGGLTPASNGSITLIYSPGGSPTTGTAMTLDYVATGGGGAGSNHGLYNVDLVNSTLSITIGGPSAAVSTAIGLQLGGTNSGIQNGTVANCRLMGFETGVQLTTGATASWGINFRDCSFVNNLNGVNFASSGIERTNFWGCTFEFNGTGVTSGASKMASSDVYYYGCSFDTQTTLGINTTGGGVHAFYGCHFENQGPQTAHYINVDGFLQIFGGQMEDDDNNPADAHMDYWINLTSSGCVAEIYGMIFFTAGRIATTVISNSGTISLNATVLSAVGSTSPFRAFVTGGTVVFDLSAYTAGNTSSASVMNAGHYQAKGSTPTVAATGLGTGSASIETGGTDSACTIRFTPTGVPGASGTVTLTFANPFTSGHSIVPSLQPVHFTGTWNARASMIATTLGTSSVTFNWDNNGVALTAGQLYQIAVQIIGY